MNLDPKNVAKSFLFAVLVSIWENSKQPDTDTLKNYHRTIIILLLRV